MKFALFILLGLTFWLCGLSPQLRTHYQPRPALQRARRLRIWSIQRPRWGIAVAIVRLA